jgi:SEN1 N terminal
MSAFPAHNVKSWLDCCHDWDANDILQHLAKLDSHPQSTLSDLPPPVSFRIFYNTANLSNEKILVALVDRLPKSRILGWPPIIPAGLLLLLFHRLPLVRQWARDQIVGLPSLTEAMFTRPYPTHYNLVINALIDTIISSAGRISSVVLPSASFHRLLENLPTNLLWNQLLNLLPILPPQSHSFSSTAGVSLFHVIVNNLRGSESSTSVFPLAAYPH